MDVSSLRPVDTGADAGRPERLPTFLVIGAAKCGTTSIADVLGDHPEVFMTSPKEPHYFSRLTRLRELRPWYSSLFEGAASFRAAGEASTSYSHPHRIEFVAPRIRDTVPDCRLVYMVRHPIRRLESDWKMRLREDRVPESVSDAADHHASLITFGLYWKHLQTYREHFPDEQLLIVFLEDFAEQPQRELSRIFRHIGVDTTFVPDEPGRQRNAADQHRRKGRLARAVAAGLRRLDGYERLRRSIPDWLRRPLKSVLTQPFDASADWDPDALDMVRAYYREDSRQLLHHCGKPLDYWKLDG